MQDRPSSGSLARMGNGSLQCLQAEQAQVMGELRVIATDRGAQFAQRRLVECSRRARRMVRQPVTQMRLCRGNRRADRP